MTEKPTIEDYCIVAQGVDWGISARRGPYANWNGFGEGVDEIATAKKLGDLVVARFHRIARSHASQAIWIPRLAHVRAPNGEALSAINYIMWREQATGEIVDHWLSRRIKPVMREDTIFLQNHPGLAVAEQPSFPAHADIERPLAA